MRAWAWVTVLLAACSAAKSEQIKLSGQATERAVTVAAFDEVELKSPDRVVVRVGGAQSVSVAGDSAVVDQVEVVVENGKLVVRRRNRMVSVNGERERATVTVDVPRLAAAGVGGPGEMDVDRVGGDKFSAAVGGAGNLRIEEARATRLVGAVGGSGTLHFDLVEADSVRLVTSGSGRIGAAGRTRTVEASIGGSGDIQARELAARTAQVSIAGAGSVAVNASDTAAVSISGSGGVTVTGGARCTTSKTGSGSVRCG